MITNIVIEWLVGYDGQGRFMSPRRRECKISSCYSQGSQLKTYTILFIDTNDNISWFSIKYFCTVINKRLVETEERRDYCVGVWCVLYIQTRIATTIIQEHSGKGNCTISHAELSFHCLFTKRNDFAKVKWYFGPLQISLSSTSDFHLGEEETVQVSQSLQLQGPL